MTRPRPTLVTSAGTIRDNIKRLSSEFPSNPELRLPKRLQKVEPWYADKIGTSWKFGFAKYIGYNGMDATGYKYFLDLEDRGGGVSICGGKANSRLRMMSVALPPQTKLYRKLSTHLESFQVDSLKLSRVYNTDIRLIVQPISEKRLQEEIYDIGFEAINTDTSSWTELRIKGSEASLRVAKTSSKDGPWYLAHHSLELVKTLTSGAVETIEGTKRVNSSCEIKESRSKMGSGDKSLLAINYSFESFNALVFALRRFAEASKAKGKGPQGRHSLKAPTGGKSFSTVEARSSSHKLRAAEEESRIDDMFDEDCVGWSGKKSKRFAAARSRNRKAVNSLKSLYGKCQITGLEHVFNNKNGEPYLEVHHIKPLGENGADHPCNMIVVSAHMHRMIHHGNTEGLDLKKIKKSRSLSFKINGKRFTITWKKRHAESVEAHS